MIAVGVIKIELIRTGAESKSLDETGKGFYIDPKFCLYIKNLIGRGALTKHPSGGRSTNYFINLN